MRTPDDIPRKRIETEGVTRIVLEPGVMVFCDACGADYTDRPDEGGIFFETKAICPACSPQWESDAALLGETQFIRARCPRGKSFADWVRQDLRK